jgi:hypothetical protein
MFFKTIRDMKVFIKDEIILQIEIVRNSEGGRYIIFYLNDNKNSTLKYTVTEECADRIFEELKQKG